MSAYTHSLRISNEIYEKALKDTSTNSIIGFLKNPQSELLSKNITIIESVNKCGKPVPPHIHSILQLSCKAHRLRKEFRQMGLKGNKDFSLRILKGKDEIDKTLNYFAKGFNAQRAEILTQLLVDQPLKDELSWDDRTKVYWEIHLATCKVCNPKPKQPSTRTQVENIIKYIQKSNPNPEKMKISEIASYIIDYKIDVAHTLINDYKIKEYAMTIKLHSLNNFNKDYYESYKREYIEKILGNSYLSLDEWNNSYSDDEEPINEMDKFLEI